MFGILVRLIRAIEQGAAANRALAGSVNQLDCTVGRLADAVEKLIKPHNWIMQGGSISFEGLPGGSSMYIVKADHADVAYSITAPDVTDSEGNPVPVGELTFEVVSDYSSVVEVFQGVTQIVGSVHFGAPGVANINVGVKNAAGTLLGSFGAQFTVTVGDPAAISGGSIVFDGLTEV